MGAGAFRCGSRLSHMTLTVGLVALVALVAMWLLGLPPGAAILLGAILAPTDPVLASEVQVDDPHDRDRLRFSLTGEAGLNDGTAFPFVMLGLGWLGLHELGASSWKWWAVDVVWTTVAGLGLGALLAHASGFLAVFAAGLALRAVEREHSGKKSADEVRGMELSPVGEEAATDPEKAPAHMAGGVLAFNTQIERIAEVALVLVIGIMLAPAHPRLGEAVFIAIFFLAIRPVAVFAGLLGERAAPAERGSASGASARCIT